MNLCTNALRALGDVNGTVLVRLRRSADAVVLEVIDDGSGMDPTTLARAFEPYFTTRRGGDGTGLGLAIIRHIVESLGGSVALESEVGRGTRSVVRLPPADAFPRARFETAAVRP